MNELNSGRFSTRREHWPARLAWLSILALAGFVTVRTAQAQRAELARPQADDARIRVMGEQLIGLKTLARSMPAAQVPRNQERLVDELDRAARTPNDRLHVAVIAGELLGARRARTKLDALARTGLDADLAADVESLQTVYAADAAALGPASRARLIQRQGYFARLALSFGVPPGSEPRRSLESGARRALIALGLVALLALGLLLGAVLCALAGVVLAAKGRLRRMYVADPSANTAFIEAFALYFVLFIVGLGWLRRLFGWSGLQWEWLAWSIIPVVTGWLGLRGVTAVERRRALGWHRGRGIVREIGAGVAGYLAGIVLMIVGLLLSYVLIVRSGISPEHPIVHILQGDRWHVLGLYALASVFAPVIEETMFRGVLFHHLRRRWTWGISAPLVSLLFAVVHPQGWVALPVLCSIAIVLAALREWRGSLIAPMVAHGLNNFVALTAALAVLRWLRRPRMKARIT